MKIYVYKILHQSANSDSILVKEWIEPGEYELDIDHDKDIRLSDRHNIRCYLSTSSFRENLKNKNIRVLI